MTLNDDGFRYTPLRVCVRGRGAIMVWNVIQRHRFHGNSVHAKDVRDDANVIAKGWNGA